MIGDKIRERRLEIGLTQAQLSKLTNIKSTTISNYENNISSPSDENIYKLMEVLKCDANYLFEWKEIKEIPLSADEKTHLKKYRFLDEFGKDAVNRVLEAEHNRCAEQTILTKWLALDEKQRQEVYDFMVNIVRESESVQSNAQSQSEQIQRSGTYEFSEQAIARSSDSNYKPAPTEEQYNDFDDLPDDMLGE